MPKQDGNGYYSQGHLDWMTKHGKELPYHAEHGSVDDISKNLKRLECRNWRAEGNKLICDTDMGELVQFLPTDYICQGVDDDGLPILTKVQVQ